MIKLKRLITSLAVILLFSGVALTASAASTVPTGRDTQLDNSGQSSSDSASDSSSDASADDKGGNLAQEFRQEAKDKLEAAQAKHQEHTQQQRQQACTARKANLTKRMANAVSQAKRHKEVMDNFYTKVKNFYTKKNLNVSNYSDLTAAADTAQSNAQTSIDALSVLDVNVDCTSQTVAASVSAFQTAVKSTRDSLKDYRKSLVSLVTAIKGASTSTDKSSDSGSSDNTNTSGQ